MNIFKKLRDAWLASGYCEELPVPVVAKPFEPSCFIKGLVKTIENGEWELRSIDHDRFGNTYTLTHPKFGKLVFDDTKYPGYAYPNIPGIKITFGTSYALRGLTNKEMEYTWNVVHSKYIRPAQLAAEEAARIEKEKRIAEKNEVTKQLEALGCPEKSCQE